MNKCPKCGKSLVLTDYEPLFTINNISDAENPEIKPKMDDKLEVTLACFDCGYRKEVDAKIIYPQLTDLGKVKFALTDFKRAYTSLVLCMQTYDRFADSFAQDYPFDFSFDDKFADVENWCKSAVDHMTEANKPVQTPQIITNQTIDWQKLLAINWDNYTSVYYQAVSMTDKDDQALPWEKINEAIDVQLVEETSDKITCWGVYLVKHIGESENIADFECPEEADQFQKFIEKNFIKPQNKNDEVITLTNFTPVNVGDVKHIDLRSIFTIKGFRGGFQLMGKTNSEPETWSIDSLDADGEYDETLQYDNEADYLSDVAYLRKAKKGKLNEKKHVNITVSTTVGADVDEENLRQTVDDALNNSDNFTSMTKDHDVYKHGN